MLHVTEVHDGCVCPPQIKPLYTTKMLEWLQRGQGVARWGPYPQPVLCIEVSEQIKTHITPVHIVRSYLGGRGGRRRPPVTGKVEMLNGRSTHRVPPNRNTIQHVDKTAL